MVWQCPLCAMQCRAAPEPMNRLTVCNAAPMTDVLVPGIALGEKGMPRVVLNPNAAAPATVTGQAPPCHWPKGREGGVTDRAIL